MTLPVLVAVLGAAVLHALWNLVVKAGDDPLVGAALVALVAGALGGATLLFLPAPDPASWPFIAASAAAQCVYFVVLAAAYRHGDFGPAYTVMRGAAAVLVTVATAVHAERAPPTVWIGALVIASGVMRMGGLRRPVPTGPRAGRGLALALLNACIIATYTVVDGIGGRRSGQAVSYTSAVFACTAVPLVAYVVAVRRGAVVAYARRHARRGLVGGACAWASYVIAVWGMTRAPIAAVAALRETSVVFATLLATWRLREPFGAGRVAAAAVVAFGIALLRIG
jgi:drug/metabolite transporter (DMT)-like permease